MIFKIRRNYKKEQGKRKHQWKERKKDNMTGRLNKELKESENDNERVVRQKRM